MRRFRPPFSLWPLRHHITLAALFAGAAVLAGHGLVTYSHRGLAEAAGELESAQAQRQQAASQVAQRVPGTDFTQRLPLAAHTEEVVRQAARYAQAHGVQISSLSVERRPASQGELGQSRLSLAMVSAYPALKAWIADLQGGNTALAVESLSLRRTSDNQQEGQLVLVLFTRD
jgi:hypothetical protein